MVRLNAISARQWMLAGLIALPLWFAFNYVIVVEFASHWWIGRSLPSDWTEYRYCVAAIIVREERLQLALWSSTFGLYDGTGLSFLINAQFIGQDKCSPITKLYAPRPDQLDNIK